MPWLCGFRFAGLFVSRPEFREFFPHPAQHRFRWVGFLWALPSHDGYSMHAEQRSELLAVQFHFGSDAGDFVWHGGSVCIVHPSRQVPFAHTLMEYVEHDYRGPFEEGEDRGWL